MTALYQSDRHVPLMPAAWDEAEARAAIREIADDTLAHWDAEKLWPVHPQDDTPIPIAGLYMGASGVIWALDYLKRHGAIAHAGDFTAALPRLITHDAVWLKRAPMGAHASLLMGDLGPLLLSMRLRPSAETADRILARIKDNDALPLLELMWGTAGSMLACVFMQGMTGDVRFEIEFRAQARRLIDDLGDAGGFKLWTCQLYGMTVRMFSIVHGFAGNMTALLRGWSWLDLPEQKLLGAICEQTLGATALHDGDCANWPFDLNRPEIAPLCQLCHGAPTIVTAFADAPFASEAFDRLMIAGGNLVWKAGPIVKGSNLCHGTAGNGYAFLKLYKRTGDRLWLDRARAFAMTAIGQCRAKRSEIGRGRYSLWTGDPGLAVYLWDCIRAEPVFPTLDVF
jgi:Lanthionine synthetase C-like protein